MSKLIEKLDGSMPMFERLAKIKKMFSSSITFWTVTRGASLFIFSQFIALSWNEKTSETVQSIFKNAPEWVKTVVDVGLAYLENNASWLYVAGAFLLIGLFLIGKKLESQSVN